MVSFFCAKEDMLARNAIKNIVIFCKFLIFQFFCKCIKNTANVLISTYAIKMVIKMVIKIYTT